jgi:hypothetical protein
MYGKMSLITVIAIAIAGCATPAPTVDTSAEAEMTFDGLYPVKNSRADQAWARPDVDLTQFSKIMLQGVGVEYRPGGESGRSFSARSRGGPYEVTEAQKARFEATMREAFLEELLKSKHFTIVTEPGPDVLLIRGALLDVVSYVPPDPVGARADVYLSKVGEATLVLELRDWVFNATEVKRLARTWGSLLRDRLDEYGETKE